MVYTTIISAGELKKELENPKIAVMDCRFDFENTDQAYQEYLEGHIPGAIYIHLDRDLASEVIPGITGRHPLPSSKDFCERLSSWGIDETIQVVAYDNKGGALAARIWWMLRWLGHKNAAVLDGGWDRWVAGKNPVESKESKREPSVFSAEEHPEYIVNLQYVDQIRKDPDYLLIDSRSAERYWGLKETIDPIAGHIPGAITAPYVENLSEEGLFLDNSLLKERFQLMLGELPPEQVVFYCGSGVTAAHNILTMVHIGYDMPQLYPGSWSEWILDPNRPIAP